MSFNLNQALNALYDRLIAIRDELSEILSLIYVMKTVSKSPVARNSRKAPEITN